MKMYIITGTFHGSIILSTSEGKARQTFHRAWNGESIISISERDLTTGKRKRLQGKFPWEIDLSMNLSFLAMNSNLKPNLP